MQERTIHRIRPCSLSTRPSPLLAVVIWGAFIAPNAAVHLPVPVTFVLGPVILGIAAVALAAAGHPSLAAVFGVITVVNALLMVIWRQ